jgi:hypothetical protein
MSLAGKIETTANAATIIAAALLSVVLVKVYLLPSPIVRSAPVVSAPEIVKGKRMDAHLLGVDWAKNHRTLVLAISTTCHFCTESAPFFRRLGEEKDVKTVAALPQSVSEGKKYLAGESVHVDEVRQVPLNSLGIMATPTLLLVNEAGVVTDVWVGKLPPDQENEVLSAMEKKVAGISPDHTTP